MRVISGDRIVVVPGAKRRLNRRAFLGIGMALGSGATFGLQKLTQTPTPPSGTLSSPEDKSKYLMETSLERLDHTKIGDDISATSSTLSGVRYINTSLLHEDKDNRLYQQARKVSAKELEQWRLTHKAWLNLNNLDSKYNLRTWESILERYQKELDLIIQYKREIQPWVHHSYHPDAVKVFDYELKTFLESIEKQVIESKRNYLLPSEIEMLLVLPFSYAIEFQGNRPMIAYQTKYKPDKILGLIRELNKHISNIKQNNKKPEEGKKTNKPDWRLDDLDKLLEEGGRVRTRRELPDFTK